VHLQCEISKVVLDPTKTALIIIDMQNTSLHSAYFPARAYSPVRAMLAAEQSLLNHGLPAARKLGFQIVWLSWSLTEEELESVSPTEMRVFGSRANSDPADYGLSRKPDPEKFLDCGERPRFESAPGVI
jgi:nicotinamidase-related amidase